MSIVCKACPVVIYANPTLAQRCIAPDLCADCEKELLLRAKRVEKQREIANEIVRCKRCRTSFRRIDAPDPNECPGCAREAARLAKLEERRKNPPMCTRCGDEEDADEECYPGLCLRCIDREIDEQLEKEEEEAEIERIKEDKKYALRKLAVNL